RVQPRLRLRQRMRQQDRGLVRADPPARLAQQHVDARVVAVVHGRIVAESPGVGPRRTPQAFALMAKAKKEGGRSRLPRFRIARGREYGIRNPRSGRNLWHLTWINSAA